MLTSATLSEDVERLKKLVLNNPVVLKLSEPDLPDSSQLTQVGVYILLRIRIVTKIDDKTGEKIAILLQRNPRN